MTTFDVVRLDDAQAGEVLTLQRAAYVPEAQRYRDPDLPPLVESLDELVAVLRSPSVVALGVREGHRLVGAVRVRLADDVAHLGRLVVAPDRQGQGIGSALLTASEEALPPGIREIRLFTGDRSAATIRLYERFGYRRQGETPEGTHALVHLTKVLDPTVDAGAPPAG
jgi:ribosomal protein S18 acetylase RimI-like enzyme